MTDKKLEMIKVTAELMHSNGYEATSVKDIMAAAQIGKGQFYYYFSSKEELGLAVIDYCFEKWQKRVIEENLAQPGDPKRKIRHMLACSIDIHNKRESKCGCFFGNLAIELSEKHEVFREKIYQMFSLWSHHLTLVIEEWRQERTLPLDCSSECLAQAIVALLEGGILLMKSKQDIAPLLNAASIVEKMLAMEGKNSEK